MTSLPRVGGVFGFIIAHMVKMGTTKLNHEQTEFLIEIVRKRSFLYGTTDDNYKDAQMAENGWKSVADSMEKYGVKAQGKLILI